MFCHLTIHPPPFAIYYYSFSPFPIPHSPPVLQVFLNHRDFAVGPDPESQFACSEVFRAVTLGSSLGLTAVADSETLLSIARKVLLNNIINNIINNLYDII